MTVAVTIHLFQAIYIDHVILGDQIATDLDNTFIAATPCKQRWVNGTTSSVTYYWLYCKSDYILKVKLCYIGLLMKNIQTWGVEDIIFWKLPWNFSFFTLSLEITDKTKLSSWIFHKTSKTKNKGPWKFHIIFSWSSLEILLHL